NAAGANAQAPRTARERDFSFMVMRYLVSCSRLWCAAARGAERPGTRLATAMVARGSVRSRPVAGRAAVLSLCAFERSARRRKRSCDRGQRAANYCGAALAYRGGDSRKRRPAVPGVEGSAAPGTAVRL